MTTIAITITFIVIITISLKLYKKTKEKWITEGREQVLKEDIIRLKTQFKGKELL